MNPSGAASAAGASARHGSAPTGVDATIESLSDPLRRRAVEVLSGRCMRSGELARELGVSPSTMSKHLRVLRRNGLLEERSDDLDARVRIYTLRSAPMAELRRWLALAEQGWTDQLRAFKEHVDRAGTQPEGPGAHGVGDDRG